ncbi:hypothetical protein [Streptomyces hydrogenans]
MDGQDVVEQVADAGGEPGEQFAGTRPQDLPEGGEQPAEKRRPRVGQRLALAVQRIVVATEAGEQ